MFKRLVATSKAPPKHGFEYVKMSCFLYDNVSGESYILTRIVTLVRFETLRGIFIA